MIMNVKNLFLTASVALASFLPITASADDWMADINDAAFVYQLSIPGAHDAATGHGTSADSFARTQEANLSAQWATGVRAFDLRPTVSGSNVNINHGIVSTKIDFRTAMFLLRDSVIAHPTEFAIVMMRHEDDNESNEEKAAWPKLVGEILADESLAPYIIPFARNLTVSEMRGKILVLTRNTFDGAKGGVITGWSHSKNLADQKNAKITQARGTTQATLYCQDFYDVSASGAVADKKAAVSNLLAYSVKQHTRSNYIWIINHTSGYSKTFFGIASVDGYRDNAATQNAAVIEYLKDESHWGPTGIIVMDFAGRDSSGGYSVMGKSLTRAIIENNSRYTPKMSALVGIEEVGEENMTEANGAALGSEVYTLDGRRVSGTAKGGLFIVSNGKGGAKKVLVP